MKKVLFTTLFIVMAYAPAWAIPNLQLYFDQTLNSGAQYNSTHESWETQGNPVTLSAFIHNQTGNTGIQLGDTFRIYSSLPEISAATDPNGNYSISISNSTSFAPDTVSPNPVNSWTYGNPNIPPHSIFDTWNSYFDFTIDSDNSFSVFNVQEDEGEVDGWRADFELAFAGTPDTFFHFDLVDVTTGLGNSGNWVNINPFSKDAIRNPGGDGGGGGGTQTPIPEPSTMLLLGAGLVGLGFYGRKKIRN